MKLAAQQVKHVAKLARLALSAEEEARFGEQLSQVLDAVEQLAAVDTTGVPPTVFGQQAVAATRADEVHADAWLTKPFEREALLSTIYRMVA